MARKERWLRVRIPGTNRYIWRETEGSGKCKLCKQSRNSLFSYGPEGMFCNLNHWLSYVARVNNLGRHAETLGGQRIRRHVTPCARENATLRAENDVLRASNAELSELVELLRSETAVPADA